MTRLEQDIVLRKLQTILRHLGLLRNYGNLGAQNFSQNIEQQLIVERLLHLIVEAAIDINTHLVVSNNQPPPSTYFDSFIQVGQLGIVPITLAQDLAPSAGLRNRLVHEYDTINPSLVYQAIEFALTQYPHYVEAVQRYLTQDLAQ